MYILWIVAAAIFLFAGIVELFGGNSLLLAIAFGLLTIVFAIAGLKSRK